MTNLIQVKILKWQLLVITMALRYSALETNYPRQITINQTCEKRKMNNSRMLMNRKKMKFNKMTVIKMTIKIKILNKSVTN